MSAAKESEVAQLVDMGFPSNRAEKALLITGSGVQAAMDWLFEHGEDANIDEPYQAPKGHTLSGGGGGGDGDGDDAATTEAAAAAAAAVQAQSLTCQDCQKKLRSPAEAQAHAHRTGHTNFAESTEEIKPLTEEERKEQARKIEQRIKEKRAEREETERREAQEKEKKRRVQGKEALVTVQSYKEKEALKAAAAAKREREMDRLAKQRVREQIAKDKAERIARNAAAAGKPAPAAAATPTAAAAGAGAAAAPANATPAPKKTYTECRLQIRLPAGAGSALTHTFPVDATIGDVQAHVQERWAAGADGSFTFMTNFPKQLFADPAVTLRDAGLVPSAVLIVRPGGL